MKYKKYPSYKDSGVEWLGKIPNEWDNTKLKYHSFIFNGNSISDNEKDEYENLNYDDSIPYIATKDINSNYLTANYDNGMRILKSESKFKKAPKDSTLLCIEGGSAGKKLTILKEDVNFVNKLACIDANNNLDKKYAHYITRSSLFNYSFNLATTGLIPGVSINQLKDFEIILPPIQEQQQIANFLDNATAKIDTLIEKQTKLIEILKEKRQAVISHAVTKGINPDVKMKDSGVEWLGDIPEHWEVKRTKFLFKIRKRIAGEEGYQVLSITQQGIKKKDTESGAGQLSMDYSKYQFAYVGDFGMNHMDLLTGYVDITKYDGVISPDYRVFTLEDKNSCPKYYLYLYQNGYKNKIFYKYGQGSSQLGRWRLPTEQFNEFRFPYPPLEEQQQIANYLNDKTSKMDKLIEKANKSIELLKEKRTALISAAVTGKIDVREMV